jgi:virginiamycin B lyase
VTSFGYPLSRIDPDSNKVVQQFVGTGGDAVREKWVYVGVRFARGKVWRLDPKLIAATLAE